MRGHRCVFVGEEIEVVSCFTSNGKKPLLYDVVYVKIRFLFTDEGGAGRTQRINVAS